MAEKDKIIQDQRQELERLNDVIRELQEENDRLFDKWLSEFKSKTCDHSCGLSEEDIRTLKTYGVWHFNTFPEDDRKVLCCTKTKAGLKNIVIGYYMERWCCGMNSNVIAWMELPEVPEE